MNRFLKACHRQPVDRIPVWLMRQAGRYQPEYRALKERVGGFWDLCTNADSIAEATLFAQRSLGADAAIIFSDITLPAWGMGMALEFGPGPRFEKPIRQRADVDRLVDYDPKDKMRFLLDGIRQTRKELDDDVSLIGFVGAPVTVAGYMIEGAPGRNWVELKKMVYGEPRLFEALLERIVETTVPHGLAQVEAGCDAIQLFDTTAGELAAPELRRFAFGYATRVIEAVRAAGVPVIYFARNIGSELEAAADIGADVLGIDWTVSMSEARRRVGGVRSSVALMGNLDPTVLFCSAEEVEARTVAILDEVAAEPGFIFNLGHGVLPETPVDNAKRVVDCVHRWKPGGAAYGGDTKGTASSGVTT